jgi:hypothetical protein
MCLVRHDAVLRAVQYDWCASGSSTVDFVYDSETVNRVVGEREIDRQAVNFQTVQQYDIADPS